MKKGLILLAIIFFGQLNAQNSNNNQQIAQTKKDYSFSLQQAIEHAIQYNYSAINAGKDIEAAKKKKWETTTMGLPQINAGVDYQNNFKQQTSLIPAEIFGGPAGTFAEVTFGTKQNMTAKATLNQLIFDGSYLVGLQASKVYLQLFENSKKKTDSETREIVTNSYGNVLLAEESIKVLERNQIILQKNYNDANQIYKSGLGEQESVEQIAITLATVKSSLNNVTRLREIALKMLKINLGIELNDALKLTDNLESLSKNNLDIAFTASTDFNVNNTIDYQIISNLTEQKRLLLKLEKSKALPSLASSVNFGYNAFSESFSFLNQKWFNYSNLGVSLNVPIFSSMGRSARTQQAKIAYEQAQTKQTETEQMIKLQFEKAKSDFEFSIEEYESAKSNLNFAERIEKKQQIKFAEGLSTSFEFSEAQRQLYAAQQNYLQSMVDVINKRAALEKITNKN